MLMDGSYDLMKSYSFGRLARYFILIIPATLVISTLNNMVRFKGVSDSADTALNAILRTGETETVWKDAQVWAVYGDSPSIRQIEGAAEIREDSIYVTLPPLCAATVVLTGEN